MMEDDVFPSSAVAELLERDYVEARLHNDHASKGEENRRLQLEYVGYVAAPYYVIVDPSTELPLAEHKLTSVGDGIEAMRGKFRSFLQQPRGQ